ncbi:MAG TPA: FtsX-like permease family protein [Bdellovibrionales bacterium]|nr:FtsX-like permease family protein [Bdellovibrionales bacterium]
MTFALLFRLAIRNLRRNIRRTALTCVTISMGLAVVIWLQALVAGRNINLVQAITSTTTGHLQLFNREFLDNRSVQKTIDDAPKNLIDRLGPDTVHARRVHVPSLISSGENSAQVLLEGIEPENESRITSIKSLLVEGEYVVPDEVCEPSNIVVGRPLAKLLNAGLGEKLVLLTQATDGTLGNQLFRISGIYETSSKNFDMLYVFAPIRCVQNLASLNGIHSVSFKFKDPKLIEDQDFIKSLRSEIGPEYQLATWQDASPLIAAMVRFGNNTIYMVCFVLFAIIAMSIVNIMLIAVTERTREFGIVLALGMSPLQVRLLVTLESFVLAVVSVLMGTALGLAVVSYQHAYGFDASFILGGGREVNQFKIDPMTYPVFDFAQYVQIVGFLLISIVAAGLFPAYRASRLDPVKAINHT